VNWKRIALVGIAAAAVATAFLVGRGSAGSSRHGATSTTSTSAGNVTSASTANTAPVATTTTSSPRISPSPTPAPRVVPSIPRISLELNRTVEIADRTTHFSANNQPVTVSDGAGGWLTAVIGVRFPTADGKGQLAFFWHNTTFIGLDTHTESNQINGISAPRVSTFAVRYTHYAPTDPLCCPSLAPVTIDYHWNGHAMTPSGLPPAIVRARPPLSQHCPNREENPMNKRWFVTFGVLSCLLLMATPASAVGGVVTPSSVVPGGSVTVTGTVPVRATECPVPGTVILQAVGLLANGSDFVAGPYDAAGHFSLRAPLSSTIALGPQGFLIRCAGRNEPLGPTAGGEIGGPSSFASFTVVGLARTGGSIGPLSDTAATAVALALIALGFAAVLAGRRRASWFRRVVGGVG
jgi:hypothetical protein